MTAAKPCLYHLQRSSDLVTIYEATRAGFVAMALERNRKATPFVAEARALKAEASKAASATDLTKIAELRPALITAAGISDKAVRNITEADLELNMKGISWTVGRRNRSVLFDVKVPLVGTNVDLCLCDCSYSDVAGVIGLPDRYIALGELKGGVDPAGADEHWKTAGSALKRIRDSFAALNLHPHTLYIGAAIATHMADEIWSDLERGVLSNAANFTKEDQVASVCNWLISL